MTKSHKRQRRRQKIAVKGFSWCIFVFCRTQVYIPKRNSAQSSKNSSNHRNHHSNHSRPENLDSSILVALLGNKNHQGNSSISGRYSSKPSAAAGSLQQQQQQQQQRSHAPKSANITISAFPTSDMLGHVTHDLDPGGSERFAMKFAENFVDQQGPEQLLPFLSDAMETPMDNPLTCLQDDALMTSSPPTGPFTSDCPFTENLYFGFSQLSGSPSFQSLASTSGLPSFGSDHVTDRLASSPMSSSWRQSHDLRSPVSPVKERRGGAGGPPGGSRLLEKFLLTKQPLNPNEGSDRVFSSDRVAERISQLNLAGDPHRAGAGADGNLLKQLLTGEMDDRQYEERGRRGASTSPGPGTHTPALPPGADLPMDMGGMDLFSGGAAADMDTLLSTDVDVSTVSVIEG